MSSDKNDEFSLDGLEDLDLSEIEEVIENALTEEEGFEFDLSADADDFSLSEDGADVLNEEVQAPDEFSLTNVGINLSLVDGNDISNEEVQPGDVIDLGDEEKEAFNFEAESSEVSEIEDSDLESFNLGEEGSLLDDAELIDDAELALSSEESLSDDLDLMDPSLMEDAFLQGSSEEQDELDEPGSTYSDPLKDYSSPQIQLDAEDLTAEARAKLEEIDAIMKEDATRGHSFALSDVTDDEDSDLNLSFDASSEIVSEVDSDDMFSAQAEENDLSSAADEPLVGDINFSDLDLASDAEEEVTSVKEIKAASSETPKRKKKKEPSVDHAQHLDDISQAYTGEMERTQATIVNLRADRDELLKRIDFLEEEKLLGTRNTLNLRAELDEKKIELTIIRKKLNDEINDLKDRLSIYEEKILVLEERNRQLQQEIDSAGQKNRIDVKRIMLRERELEQKLELLKADAETQIRNRDLKILELKRKIDAMEFDMESISQQEKKTLESRFELEDKLDKAIRTLRTAISTLEEDGNRSATLEAIKKNIEV